MSDCQPVTTQELIDLLALWVEAEKAISTGQNYSVEGLSVSRADLLTVINRQNDLRRQICDRQVAARGGRVGVITPSWT